LSMRSGCHMQGQLLQLTLKAFKQPLLPTAQERIAGAAPRKNAVGYALPRKMAAIMCGLRRPWMSEAQRP